MAQEYILANNPNFCISSLAQAVNKLVYEYCDDLADLSPLTSPDLSPNGSPTIPTLTLDPPLLTPLPLNTAPAMTNPRPEPANAREKRKAAKKEKGRAHRRKQCALQRATDSYTPSRQKAEDKYLQAHPPSMLETNTASFPTTKGSFIAARSPYESKQIRRLDELVGPSSSFKFRLIEWDGRTPTPIADKEGRVIGVLAGRPDDDGWDHLMERAVDSLRSASEMVAKVPPHRRGAFPTINGGVSHGGSQTRPGNLRIPVEKEALFHRLNSKEPFIRIAGFGSSIFATWAPKLHEYYRTTKDQLRKRYPHLTWPFPGSVFSTITYNLGPSTVCFPHTDFGNLTFGWCAITALSCFDHTKGSHLVLWDCGVVIQFPPGSTVLIPSALVAHSNAAIRNNETRYSVTQYTAGGIFRWVEFGFKTKDSYMSSLTADEKPKIMEKLENRWSWGLSLFRILPGFKKL